MMHKVLAGEHTPQNNIFSTTTTPTGWMDAPHPTPTHPHRLECSKQHTRCRKPSRKSHNLVKVSQNHNHIPRSSRSSLGRGTGGGRCSLECDEMAMAATTNELSSDKPTEQSLNFTLDSLSLSLSFPLLSLFFFFSASVLWV